MLRWSLLTVAGLLVLGLCNQSTAKVKKGDVDAIKPLEGAVVSVDGSNVKVTKKGGKKTTAEDVVVVTDVNTVVTIDGVAARITDLARDMRVKVIPATGTATKIEATQKPKKDKSQKKDKGAANADN